MRLGRVEAPGPTLQLGYPKAVLEARGLQRDHGPICGERLRQPLFPAELLGALPLSRGCGIRLGPGAGSQRADGKERRQQRGGETWRVGSGRGQQRLLAVGCARSCRCKRGAGRTLGPGMAKLMLPMGIADQRPPSSMEASHARAFCDGILPGTFPS
jgi:hypothetical protein